MDGATIQAKVYAGLAKAAQRIGQTFDVFRPVGATAPLALMNRLYSLQAAFDSSPGWKFSKANEYGDPLWYPVMDASQVNVGDYMTGNGSIYFIAGKQFLLPALAVECNRCLKLTRQIAVTAVGAVGYGGNVPATASDLLGAGATANYWPCSILLGGKGMQEANLPASTREKGWMILLPGSIPVAPMYSDILTDDLGHRYAIEAAEQTDLGWRINATEVHS